MTAKLLDGKRVAREIREEVGENAKPLIERGIVPCLAAVLVGDNQASQLYVRSKVKACEEAGLGVGDGHPASIDEARDAGGEAG